MVYVLESIQKQEREYYECLKCGYREERINNKKVKTKIIKTNIDRSEPIRKVVIPKFQDRFYLIGTKDGISTYYNPVSNIRRIESEVKADNQRNSLLSRLTANKVGLPNESDF